MKKIIALTLGVILIFSQFGFSATSSAAPIRMGVTEEPDSFNPLAAYERSAYENFMLIYDSLYVLDENQVSVPNLAASHTVSEDYLTWTFKLRNDVLWHDGEAFTAEDVKFTFELIQNTEISMYYDFVADIDTIETPDDYTVVMTTLAPKANMLQNVTPILPAHIWADIALEEVELFENETPVGTGPFKFKEWKKNEYWSLESNSAYFKGAPKSGGFIFKVFANRDTLAQSLKLGEIDVALGLYNNQVKTIEAENVSVHSFVENGFTQLAFNAWDDAASKGNPLLKDKVIRQAIDMGIDKQKIIDMVYEGGGVAGTTMIPVSQVDYHYSPSADELRGFNPEAAKALLEKQGYTDRDGDGVRESASGEKLSFNFILRSENTNEVKAGQMIKSYLVDIGIETLVETLDDGALIDRTFDNANFDMFIWGWGGDTDPGTILRILVTDQIGNLNDAYYSNPEYDEWVAKQATVIDPAERVKMLHEAQKIIYDEVPYSILMYENDLQLYRNDLVGGIVPVASGALFYADTPLNYISAYALEDAGTGTSGSGAINTGMIVGLVAVVVLGGVILVMTKGKNKKKASW